MTLSLIDRIKELRVEDTSGAIDSTLNGEVAGSATFVGGVLMLTVGGAGAQTGTWRVSDSTIIPNNANPLYNFELVASVYMGIYFNSGTQGAGSGDSMSFSFGAGNGLVVSLVTSSNQVKVYYAGTLLGTSTCPSCTLQNNQWTTLRIQLVGTGLTVFWGSTSVVTNLIISGWNPQTSWRWGIAASTRQ